MWNSLLFAVVQASSSKAGEIRREGNEGISRK